MLHLSTMPHGQASDTADLVLHLPIIQLLPDLFNPQPFSFQRRSNPRGPALPSPCESLVLAVARVLNRHSLALLRRPRRAPSGAPTASDERRPRARRLSPSRRLGPLTLRDAPTGLYSSRCCDSSVGRGCEIRKLVSQGFGLPAEVYEAALDNAALNLVGRRQRWRVRGRRASSVACKIDDEGFARGIDLLLFPPFGIARWRCYSALQILQSLYFILNSSKLPTQPRGSLRFSRSALGAMVF